MNITNLNKLVACSWGRNPNLPAWLTPEILKFTEEKKLLNTGAVILFSDKDIMHLLRTKKNKKQKLTFPQVLRMPAAFRKPSDVYYDIQDNALIYIQKLQKNEIEDEKDIIKFVVKPTKNSWVLRTAGRIKLEDLKIQRYKKIKDYQWKDSHFPSSDEL